MLAARNGSDPSLNSTLRQAIDNAKAENVPNDNIKRAIAKGSSEGKMQLNFMRFYMKGMVRKNQQF